MIALAALAALGLGGCGHKDAAPTASAPPAQNNPNLPPQARAAIAASTQQNQATAARMRGQSGPTH